MLSVAMRFKPSGSQVTDTESEYYDSADKEAEESEEEEQKSEEGVEEGGIEASPTQRVQTPMLEMEDSLPASQGLPPGSDDAATQHIYSQQEQDIREPWTSSQPLSANDDAPASQGPDEATPGHVLLDTRHCDKELATLTASSEHKARRKALLSQCPNKDRRCIVCRKKDRQPRQNPRSRHTHQPAMYPFCESCEAKGRKCNTPRG